MRQKTKQNIIIVPNIVDDFFRNEEDKVINDTVKQVCFTGHIKQTKGVQEILSMSFSFPKINFLLAGPIYEKFDKKLVPKKFRSFRPLRQSTN